MDYNNYNQTNEQSVNFTCIKIVLFISFFYNLALCIACFAYDVILNISTPIVLHCLGEIIILFGIRLKNYCIYIIGYVICLLPSIYEFHIIFLLLVLASAYDIDTDGEKTLILITILTGILIIIECSVYGYYNNKIRHYFNSNTGGIIYPVQNINVQPIYPPFQNIGDNQNIATPILYPQDNQGIIYVNNQSEHNIDNQGVAYAFPQPEGSGLNIPPQVQNIENQGAGLNIPPPEQIIENQGSALNIPPPSENIDTQGKN